VAALGITVLLRPVATATATATATGRFSPVDGIHGVDEIDGLTGTRADIPVENTPSAARPTQA
jgi:hypothetical protein